MCNHPFFSIVVVKQFSNWNEKRSPIDSPLNSWILPISWLHYWLYGSFVLVHSLKPFFTEKGYSSLVVWSNEQGYSRKLKPIKQHHTCFFLLFYLKYSNWQTMSFYSSYINHVLCSPCLCIMLSVNEPVINHRNIILHAKITVKTKQSQNGLRPQKACSFNCKTLVSCIFC